MNQYEVVKVKGEAGNHQRRQRLDQQRERNLKEVLHRACTVHRRRFVQIVRNRLQQAHAQDHHVRIPEPGIDDDNHTAGGRWVAEPRRFDAKQRAQHHVDFTEALVEQPFENQNRDKRRHGVRQNQQHAVNGFALQRFPLHYAGQNHADCHG
ncbi:hypothetical protein D3C71_1426610 [compost metagenome]